MSLGFTGVNIAPETVADLAGHDNIIGMKDTSGNIVQVSQLIRLTEEEGLTSWPDPRITSCGPGRWRLWGHFGPINHRAG